jgi:hypothetical protein
VERRKRKIREGGKRKEERSEDCQNSRLYDRKERKRRVRGNECGDRKGRGKGGRGEEERKEDMKRNQENIHACILLHGCMAY